SDRACVDDEGQRPSGRGKGLLQMARYRSVRIENGQANQVNGESPNLHEGVWRDALPVDGERSASSRAEGRDAGWHWGVRGAQAFPRSFVRRRNRRTALRDVRRRVVN